MYLRRLNNVRRLYFYHANITDHSGDSFVILRLLKVDASHDSKAIYGDFYRGPVAAGRISNSSPPAPSLHGDNLWGLEENTVKHVAPLPRWRSYRLDLVRRGCCTILLYTRARQYLRFPPYVHDLCPAR